MLTEEEKELLPDDNSDYRDFILTVASRHNWLFERDKFHNEIVKIQRKKGLSNILGRLDSNIRELEDDRCLIKRTHGRMYDVTNRGINEFNSIYNKQQSFGLGGIPDDDTAEQEQQEDNEPITEEYIPIDFGEFQDDYDDDYIVRKLNRNSDEVEQVESNVRKSSFWIMWASITSAIAIVAQVCISLWGTAKVQGEISITQRQEKLDSLREALRETTAAKGLQTLKSDSLERELQILSKKLDSAFDKQNTDGKKVE